MTATLEPSEVVGLKEALKVLNTLDKSLRREITKDFKQIMQPVIVSAIGFVPATEPPLSGMKYAWHPKGGQDIMSWKADRVKKNLKAFTSGKKVRDTGLGFKQNLAVFGMKWSGPQASIFDMAGKASPGSPLARALTAKYGSPSRAMWKAYERAELGVQQDVKQLVDKVMREASRLTKGN